MIFEDLIRLSRVRCEAGVRVGGALTLALAAGACSSEPSNLDPERAAQDHAVGAPAVRTLSANVRAKVDVMMQQTQREAVANGRLGVARVFELSPDADIISQVDVPADAPVNATQQNGPDLQKRFAGRQITPVNGNPVLDRQNPISGYQIGSQQAVTWCSGNDVNELSYPFSSSGHGWHHLDLTLELGAPNCGGQSIAFGTSYDGHKQVIYLDPSNQLQRVYNDGVWRIDTDSTFAGTLTTGTIAGWQTSYNNQMHVAFIDPNHGNDLSELFYDTAWHSYDLTSHTGAAPARPVLVGYQTSNQQEHLIFIDGADEITELYYQSSNWHTNSILKNSTPYRKGLAAVTAAAGTHVAAYETSYNGQEHVDFIDNIGHLSEVFYSGSTWYHADLTAEAMAANELPNPATPIAGYQTTYNNQQHVVYVSTNGHLIELYYQSGAWHLNNLSNSMTSGLPIETFALAGYQTTSPNQEHVDFVTSDNHIHELYYDTSWHDVDLSGFALSLTFTSVEGNWQVPTVQQPAEPAGSDGMWDMSTWVGLNGFGQDAGEILQTGVAQTLDASHHVTYVPWYEWYVPQDVPPPANFPYVIQTRYPMTFMDPKAGDQMYGKVTLNPDGTGTCFLWDKNISGANAMTMPLAPPPYSAMKGGQSAEWILEAPGQAEPDTAIPDFSTTPVVFTQGLATDSQGAQVGPTDIPGTNEDIKADDLFINEKIVSIRLTETSAANNRVEIDFCPGQNGCN
jgi:hypothetical protein